MRIKKRLLLSIILSSTLLSATTYSEGWRVYDNQPEGAIVSTVFDKLRNSNVIELKGEGRANSYFIGARKGANAWKNSQEKILEWKMKFSEKFKVSVYIKTQKGERVIIYDYRMNDRGVVNNKYIFLGLGERSKSGEWVDISRNLEADLNKYEPQNKILLVNGFKMQGSGRIDDIKLVDKEDKPNPNIPPIVDNGEVIRGPYLQQGSPNSIIVKWRTKKATNSKVVFGKDINSLNLTKESDLVTTSHEVKLTNLDVNSRYYYRIGNTTEMLKGDSTTFFKTAPKVGSSEALRIWVLGDSGSTSQRSKDVYSAYKNATGDKDTDLILMLGDNAYQNGTDKEYQSAVFDKYSGILAQTSLWSVYGNHDARTPNTYFNAFTFPTKGELGGVASSTENYYSFNYGNIHFVILDSSESSIEPNGKMMKWLEKDLEKSKAKWLISAWHHTPYTRGSYDSDKSWKLRKMRENFLPILEKYGVDLVMAGHSHVYERSKFINGHYGLSSTFGNQHIVQKGNGKPNGDGAYVKKSKKGTVYIVLGSSGKPKEGVLLGHPIMVSESGGTTGSVIMEVNNNRLDIQYITEKGEVIDSFRIQK